MFLWVYKTNLEGAPRDPNFRGGNGTRFNFCGPFSAWKRSWRIFMYLYTRFSRKCYVKLWHKSSYGPVRQIEKGFHVIRYSGGDEMQLSQFWGTFFSMETRLTNLYTPSHAFLPQMLRQTLAQIFLWACKTNWEGVPRDPIFWRGWNATESILGDLFQHGNEADQSLYTFTRVSPANVTSNFGTYLLMGMQNKLRGDATWSDIPGEGMARNTISEDLCQHGNESLRTVTCVSPANLKSNLF